MAPQLPWLLPLTRMLHIHGVPGFADENVARFGIAFFQIFHIPSHSVRNLWTNLSKLPLRTRILNLYALPCTVLSKYFHCLVPSLMLIVFVFSAISLQQCYSPNPSSLRDTLEISWRSHPGCMSISFSICVCGKEVSIEHLAFRQDRFDKAHSKIDRVKSSPFFSTGFSEIPSSSCLNPWATRFLFRVLDD